MEKISLLLLVVKKSLIGSAIVGVLGFGSLTGFFKGGKGEDSKAKHEKSIGTVPTRPGKPPME